MLRVVFIEEIAAVQFPGLCNRRKWKNYYKLIDTFPSMFCKLISTGRGRGRVLFGGQLNLPHPVLVGNFHKEIWRIDYHARIDLRDALLYLVYTSL